MEYYVLTLLVLGAINCILVLGFNLQFSHAGILNFAYIVLVAVGAYMTGIAGVPPAPHNGYTFYLGGFGWSFPWTIIFGTACAGVFGLIFGGLTLLRLRFDYLALTLFAIGTGLQVLSSTDVKLFNGSYGINGIAQPGGANISQQTFQLICLALCLGALLIIFAGLMRLDRSPLGRSLRAVREDEVAAASLGKRVFRLKMLAFVIGAIIAGLGGSLLATYVGGWNPQSWLPTETIGLLAAAMVGGRGRYLGAVVGSIVVIEAITEATRYLPSFGGPELLPALQAMAVGLILLAFLWWLPQGILPEKKERFAIIAGRGLKEALPSFQTSTHGDSLDRVSAPLSGERTLLELSRVSCSFGGIRAVDDVSLHIPRGGFIGIIGPNGAGKSTLLDCISGMHRKYAGRVVFEGRDVSRWSPHRLARHGLIRTFQVSRLFPQMTVLSNLMAAPVSQMGERPLMVLRGAWRAQEDTRLGQAWALLRQFGLERVANNYCSDLSGGQQRLVELCRAMMCEPEVLLLDEPFAGVSPANRTNLSDALRYLWREHKVTIVMIEHRLEVVETLCDSVVVMANGRVAFEGQLAEVRSNQLVLDAYLGRTA